MGEIFSNWVPTLCQRLSVPYHTLLIYCFGEWACSKFPSSGCFLRQLSETPVLVWIHPRQIPRWDSMWKRFWGRSSGRQKEASDCQCRREERTEDWVGDVLDCSAVPSGLARLMGRPEISHWESCIVWNPAWLSTSAVVTDRELSMGSVTSGWMQWSIQKNRRGCQSVCCCSSVTKSCPTLWPYGLQHTRLPCPSLSTRVCSNSCPLSQWCHPTISSSPFFSCPQSFQWRSFPVSWLFTSGAKVLELQRQHQSFQWIIRVDFLMLRQQEVCEECGTS